MKFREPLAFLASRLLMLSMATLSPALAQNAPTASSAKESLILTPPSPATPQIHGAKVFGVSPGAPFLFTIPATGNRPMRFSAEGLPDGLKVDASTGLITGTLSKISTYPVTLHAENALGKIARPLKIVVGNQIGLTPAMGWNSFNTYDVKVTQQQILTQAHALIDSGLAQHGWSYLNTDDGWQGARGGALNAIQPNEGFPDIAGMVNEIHGLGLKAGIYSSPWVTTYGHRIGGSSEDSSGKWDSSFTKKNNNSWSDKFPFIIAPFHFAVPDAKQIAFWKFDYFKYDWAPIHAADSKEMADALHSTGRDIIYSLSNNGKKTLLKEIAEVAPTANSWRTTDDVHDKWAHISNSAYNEDPWASYAGPGHFNDPDMLVVGTIGWGHPHRTLLTPDEQYTQVSMWCLLSAPLILGCDLTKLDPFTLSLITNDEVIDIDQDSLGKQATCVSKTGDLLVYAKPLEDGSWAVGLCNRGITPATVTLHWSDIQLAGSQIVRDLWRQKDLGSFSSEYSSLVPPHGVVLVRVTPVR